MDSSVIDKSLRTVRWVSNSIRLIDQPKLPGELKFVDCKSVDEACVAIKTMVVRGAPAIGATGGYAMVFAAREVEKLGQSERIAGMKDAKKLLDASRPTAVNLSWATQRMVEVATEVGEKCTNLGEVILKEAETLADQDVEINLQMARHGAAVVPQGANILHHCNTGSLATVYIGTAIGVIYEAHKQGKNIHVWVDETRPRLQGARLSAWELMRENVPIHLIADNAAGLLMLNGKVDIVLYGADRVAANGDVANKIGTYKLSVVAKENNIPVYAVVPTSTIDLSILKGEDIPIEERGEEEVTTIGGKRIAPANCKVYNPAFDITPNRYLTGIITEMGICSPPFEVSLKKAKEDAERRIREMRSKNPA